MAFTAHHFTAAEVCDLLTGVGEDHEFIFPGSDDDFDMSEVEFERDPLDREQGKQTIKSFLSHFTNTYYLVNTRGSATVVT